MAGALSRRTGKMAWAKPEVRRIEGEEFEAVRKMLLARMPGNGSIPSK